MSDVVVGGRVQEGGRDSRLRSLPALLGSAA